MPHIDDWATTVYQPVMALVAIAALVGIRRGPSPLRWHVSTAVLVLVAAGLARGLAHEKFLVMRLAAYGLFLHLGLWLGGASVLLWRPVRWLSVASGALLAMLAAVAADAFLVEPTWLEVSHTQVRSAKLSRTVRIVLLADLQTDQFGRYEQEVFRRVLAEKPDLVLLAGDYLQAEPAQRRQIARQLNEFLGRLPLDAPLGVFAVRGNVDRSDWTLAFEGLKVRTVPRTESFDLGDLRLTCLSERDSFQTQPNVPSGPAGKFHLVLGHSPRFSLGGVPADLMLAGHTHGGQVRLPLVGPITTLSDVPGRYAAGLAERRAGGRLFVSRGVGMERENAPRLRFFCRPELAVIDLLPE